MFSALRALRPTPLAATSRVFSTSQPRAADVAKLTLVGNLVRDAEIRQSRKDKPFAVYTVVTNSNFGLNDQGERQSVSTFHRILCFQPAIVERISQLKKGTKVFVQADYSIREPDPNADPMTPQGQRQIFLTQDTLKVLRVPRSPEQTEATSDNTSETFS
ncbi:hypothetical protein D9756_000767 [Leucocoprinus leucothites]|uniref:Nucleic acid-binding protein n=1 Tax=Leucocoprinus leucothites TaxID=201217 RepID=A0A8H5LN65_9AGAR|nr:hypothetical protein D9756_000767 [Leucoagaricus leucothites]